MIRLLDISFYFVLYKIFLIIDTMKRRFFVLSILSLLARSTIAQNPDTKNNILGIDFAVANSQPLKFSFTNQKANINYNSLQSSASLDWIVWYKKEFNKDSSDNAVFTIKTGIGGNNRYQTVQLDTFIFARINESFYEVPILIGLKLGRSKKRASLSLLFGTDINILNNQKLFSQMGVALPQQYQKESKFSAYTKLSLLTEISLNIPITETTPVIMGLKSNYDIVNPLTQSDNSIPVFPFYKSYCIFIGFGKYF